MYFNVREYAGLTGAKIRTDKGVSVFNLKTGAFSGSENDT
jgi:hypothetical protein